MEWGDALRYIGIAGAGIAIGIVLVHLAWRLHWMWRIRRAGPRLLWAAKHRIWREPTASDLSDLRFGPGGSDGVPAPPFSSSRNISPDRSRVWPCTTAAGGSGV